MCSETETERERHERERERGWVSSAGMRTFFAALGLGLAAVPGIRACVVKCLGTCVLSAAVCLLSLVKCTHDSEIGYLWHHRRTAVTRIPQRGGISRVLQWTARGCMKQRYGVGVDVVCSWRTAPVVPVSMYGQLLSTGLGQRAYHKATRRTSGGSVAVKKTNGLPTTIVVAFAAG